ncbi:hypothetical protein MKEN_01131300 [Mycena kentingensis (nom. inval.)]|nr:hypothetical protein MKEN_01131300 [Mycena kentingensis (nom. inval.)]
MSCCGEARSSADAASSSSTSSPRHQVVDRQPRAQPEPSPYQHMAAHHVGHSPPPALPRTSMSRRTATPSIHRRDESYFSATTEAVATHARHPSLSSQNDAKLVIAIDFGTTFSGVAYGSSRFASGQILQIIKWPRSFETFRKIPTCLLYDDRGHLVDWGLNAKNARLGGGLSRFEWFKLFLEPRALRDEGELDPRLPSLPFGKTPLDLITDFLRELWNYCRSQISQDIGAIADLNSADVWLTVPAAWDARGCALMRTAAISAGLVQSAFPGDRGWRERLKIITEPEAAAVHCANLTELHQLRPSQNFIVCDAGGGTVDLAVYKIIGDPAHLEIAEITARSGANCGSLYLDIRFRHLVKTLLADHPTHCDAASLAYFMNSFSEADKLTYAGRQDDSNVFYFTCFNVVDSIDDPSIGLVNGQLGIPGILLREAVFDPVVDEVLNLIGRQIAVSPPIDALLLVGGFSGSAYLKARIEERFGGRVSTIARPPDSETATLRGAARYGLARRPLVSQLVTPRSYVLKVRKYLLMLDLLRHGRQVKLPAEPEDRVRRPGYIQYNDAGVEVCENRLQYLVRKGAIIRKGQRLKTEFCKFSRTRDDSTFTATLYTFDSEGTDMDTARYADETALRRVCDWRVDLRAVQGWADGVPSSTGFFTNFWISLELDGPTVGATNNKMLSTPRKNIVDALAPIANPLPAWSNWGKTYHCSPAVVFTPTSVAECQLVLQLAKLDRRVVRAVGIGHSPSDIACTTDYMLNTTRLNKIIEINTRHCYVVAEAGIALSDLLEALAPHGLAMRNLGSISDQTLGGIVATTTHGAGSAFGVLSTHVLALTVLLPDNRLVSCSPSENKELFRASVCGLGATGILINITLELEPAFNLRDTHTVRPFDEVMANLDQIKDAGEHVRLWWFPAVGMVRCSVMDRTSEPAQRVASWLWDSPLGFHVIQFLLLLTRFARPLPHPSFPSAIFPKRFSIFSIARTFVVALVSVTVFLWGLLLHLASRLLAHLMRDANVWASSVALALSGPKNSVTIDRSDRIFNIECRYPQYTTEWAIPADRGEACLRSLSAWLAAEQGSTTGERPHFPIEIRWSAGDDLWLSPANGSRETCWIGIVQFKFVHCLYWDKRCSRPAKTCAK